MHLPASSRRQSIAPATWVVGGLSLCALVLGIWVFFLGAELHGRYNVRNWSSTWGRIDLCQVAGLLATARLVHRRSLAVAPIAAATATLIAMDAWFDVMTAQAGSDWYTALFMAIVIEIPLAVGLALLAWSAPAWCEPRPRPTPTGRFR